MNDANAEPVAAPVDALHALLSRLIDYAGLFPPAKLDMGETVRRYAEAMAGDDAWMLGRLIVPAARLDEFEAAAAAHLPTGPDADPWQLSCLTPPAGDEGLNAALLRIAQFNDRHGDAGHGLASIDVIELRGDDAEAIESALDAIPDHLFPFFELPLAEDPRGLIATLVGGEAGAKARTGGLTPELYPAPAHLARFIAACAGGDVPFKATAGMHHPLRHHSDAVNTMEFGFLNVFVAGCLADQVGADAGELIAVLEEQSLDAFTIRPDGIAWGRHDLSTDRIAMAREQFAVSFGSCSFDEPGEDLRGLGLL